VVPSGSVAFDYVLVDIDQSVVECAVDLSLGSFFNSFGSRAGPPPVIRIGVGDVLQIAIFESSAGGLFIPPEAGVRPGNFVTLPAQQVDRSGTIAIPYAGDIRAAGRLPAELERDIQARLNHRAVEPQVVVTVLERNAAEVAVVGDGVGGASNFRLRLAGDRIVDVIAKAGGIRYPGYEIFVTLQRNNKRATVYFPTLVKNPSENIFVQPGDTVYVYREQQRFVAVGALGAGGGASGQFPFDQEKLSLNEAIAKAGGLLDSRAGPERVFLYRLEFREALEKMGVDLSRFPPDQKYIPTIYRANFRDPSSFFFAQGFHMRHRDIIYVANADAIEVVKFLDFIRAFTSTVVGVGGDSVGTVGYLR
jgi:polysaccharide export outer membrane protein